MRATDDAWALSRNEGTIATTALRIADELACPAWRRRDDANTGCALRRSVFKRTERMNRTRQFLVGRNVMTERNPDPAHRRASKPERIEGERVKAHIRLILQRLSERTRGEQQVQHVT